MTKRLLVFGAVAALAAAAVATTADGQSAPTTLNLVQKDTHFKFIDVAPKGGLKKPPSVGDSYVLEGKVTGQATGSTNLTCTVTLGGAHGRSNCTGTLLLASGSITIAGVSRSASSGDTFAITGGTGSYLSAKGTVQAKQGKGGAEDIAVTLG